MSEPTTRATVIQREGASALGYTMTEGEPELRSAIAADASARGIAADAEEVLVSAGALQAIDLACRVYLRPGDVVVAESPAFANALSAFRNHGAHVGEFVDGRADVAKATRPRREVSRPAWSSSFRISRHAGETMSTAADALLALARRRRRCCEDDRTTPRYRGTDIGPRSRAKAAE